MLTWFVYTATQSFLMIKAHVVFGMFTFGTVRPKSINKSNNIYLYALNSEIVIIIFCSFSRKSTEHWKYVPALISSKLHSCITGKNSVICRFCWLFTLISTKLTFSKVLVVWFGYNQKDFSQIPDLYQPHPTNRRKSIPDIILTQCGHHS